MQAARSQLDKAVKNIHISKRVLLFSTVCSTVSQPTRLIQIPGLHFINAAQGLDHLSCGKNRRQVLRWPQNGPHRPGPGRQDLGKMNA